MASGKEKLMGRNTDVLAGMHGEEEVTAAVALAPRPLIAVTTSEMRDSHSAQVLEGEPPQAEMALGMKYLKAIEAAGGIPVVIPPITGESLGLLLAQVAGVCLSGGPDLDPRAYGADPHARLGPTWSELDRFELATARAADVHGLPILAICRGLQVLNVARGGTLHQHLPDVVGDSVKHRQERPGGEATHAVEIEPSSRLSALLGTCRAEVNSFHHQSVDRLGEGLVATALADDGTIEAIEAPDREFVLGVQWHAECLVDRPEHAALFSAFVEAARGTDLAGTRLARVA